MALQLFFKTACTIKDTRVG